MSEDDQSEFGCARADIRLQWLTDPERPNETLVVLYEKGELLCQVGQNRDAILKKHAVSNDPIKHRRVRLVDSKKVNIVTNSLSPQATQSWSVCM